MSGKLAIACIALAVTCQVACADDVDVSCLFNIPACDEIITSPSVGPDQKALAYRYRGELRTNAGENRSAIADFQDFAPKRMICPRSQVEVARNC